MKLICLMIIVGVSYASQRNSNLVCTQGVHKVYVTQDGVELVYKKQRGSPLECKGIFVFPKGYGFSMECPEASISKNCKNGGLTFSEGSMGNIGQICGKDPGYHMMKEGQEGKRCKLIVKFWSEGGKSYNSFRCSIKPYMTKPMVTHPPTTIKTTTTTTTTTTTITTTTTSLICTLGNLIGGVCYYLDKSAVAADQSTAIGRCTANNMVIADIVSPDVQSYLVGVASGSVWIGIEKTGATYDWMNSGTAVDLASPNWGSGQPSNSNNCVIASGANSHTWYDYSCADSSTVNDIFCSGPPTRA